MAGAFTHFIISDVAKRRRTSLGNELYRLLNRQSEFVSLGSVSPDLPYLSFKFGGLNWADIMHYEKTNGIVISGHGELKSKYPFRDPTPEPQLAWLFGYVSHLVADATIHPVVQAIVGPYDLNDAVKEEHRICEMTQDSLIFNARKNNDIYYAEFSSILKFCRNSKHLADVIDFWKRQARLNYLDKKEEANPLLWFTTYAEAIDTAEGGSGCAAFFRHLGFAKEFIYRTKQEITSNYPSYESKYYANVRLPNEGQGPFRTQGLEAAVVNVANAWRSLYDGLSEDFAVGDVIKNWNLDTGVDLDSEDKEVTYWKE